MTEEVLVFDSQLLDKMKDLNGFSIDKDHLRHLPDIIRNSRFIDRKLAEENEETKQIIPYIFISKGMDILAYSRTKKSGEGRLHNKWSIGFGGHINPIDFPTIPKNMSLKLKNILTVSNAIERELEEELDWKDRSGLTARTDEVGIIYDSSDAVGRVHFGYVLNIDISESGFDGPVAKENAIGEIKWLSVQEILKLPNLENWSKLIAEKLSENMQESYKTIKA